MRYNQGGYIDEFTLKITLVQVPFHVRHAVPTHSMQRCGYCLSWEPGLRFDYTRVIDLDLVDHSNNWTDRSGAGP